MVKFFVRFGQTGDSECVYLIATEPDVNADDEATPMWADAKSVVERLGRCQPLSLYYWMVSGTLC